MALPRAVQRPTARDLAVQMGAVLSEDRKEVADDVFGLSFFPGTFHEFANDIIEFQICVRDSDVMLHEPSKEKPHSLRVAGSAGRWQSQIAKRTKMPSKLSSLLPCWRNSLHHSGQGIMSSGSAHSREGRSEGFLAELT